jgi:hypothetical protein
MIPVILIPTIQKPNCVKIGIPTTEVIGETNVNGNKTPLLKHLRVNAEKSTFCAEEIEYLGYWISKSGIHHS